MTTNENGLFQIMEEIHKWHNAKMCGEPYTPAQVDWLREKIMLLATDVDEYKVWLIWQYDNGVVPEKELWSVCLTEQIAEEELKRVQEENPDYEYEIEPETLQTRTI